MLLHSTPYIYVNLFNFSYHVGVFYSRRVDSRVARRVARVSRFRVCVVDTLVDMRVASLVARVSRFRVELVDRLPRVYRSSFVNLEQPRRHVVRG